MAIAVALVSASMIANGSIEGSGAQVVHAVIGPATLQLRAREQAGLEQRLLARVRRIAGVEQAAPVLEQSATITGLHGRHVSVDLAGADPSLARLDGLDRSLPLAVFAPGGLGLSAASADALGIERSSTPGVEVTLRVGGKSELVQVASVLGPEAAGALSEAHFAVVPLGRLQRITGTPGRLTRILVRVRHGHAATVARALRALAGDRLIVAPADADIALLRQALRPSDQASEFFAGISALLGCLFAFNATLLTVPERRAAIADLRLIGTKRMAIVQIVAFQALCLGVIASLVGLVVGYGLSRGALHQSSGYVAEAFTIGTNTVVGALPLVVAFVTGILATFVASSLPLLDLRGGRALDAVYFEDPALESSHDGRKQARLALTMSTLVALATGLYLARASLAFVASGVLALATVLAVPLALAGVLRTGAALVMRRQRLTILQVALTSLRAATLRSLALAATGAVAIFGGVALGGSRSDLLRGIDGFSHSYAADADVWVGNPGDNQATMQFHPGEDASRIARLPGVSDVQAFQGGFLEMGKRRVWVIARPPGNEREVLASQIVEGDAARATRRLGEGGWVVVSRQIAAEHHVALGGVLTLPTPSGDVRFRVAATTTNLAWSPGTIFLGTGDFSRLWRTTLPSALGVKLDRGVSANAARATIAAMLGPRSGLEVSTAAQLEERIDTLTREGLSRLGEISTLLVAAAILAMAAALGSSMWQRRASLAGLRLAGVRPQRLRRVLLTEAALMLSAGCVTGAVAGLYGQVIIDGYLRYVTDFPVAKLAPSVRPIEILALVIAIALAVVAVPGWAASRVSPTLALDD